MEHLFIKKAATEPVLVLLHGTGGDERDLLALGEFLMPNASLLGIRGEVSEQGMNRFFRRFGEGQFDLVDLAKQTENLVSTLDKLASQYDFDLAQVVLVGYSNGANIGGHLLLTQELPINRGIFFHSMLLVEKSIQQSQQAQKVWLSYGRQDPLVAEKNFNALKAAYAKRGTEISVYEAEMSHGITQEELAEAKRWLTR